MHRSVSVAVLCVATLSSARAQSSMRDSMEAMVLRVALAPVIIRDSAVFSPRAGMERLCGVRVDCVPDSLRSRFAASLGDFRTRHADTSAFAAATVRELIGLLQTAAPRTDDATCQSAGPIHLVATHVGFDAQFTTAVVTYAESRGEGPNPSRCGWAAGTTIFLRRVPGGAWEVVTHAGGWMT
jgi:hypothetical protein